MSRRILVYTFNILIILLLIPVFWISYNEGSKLLGIRPQPVEVVGTGSMYPSLYWDETQGGPEQSQTTGIEEFRSSPRMYHYFPGITVLDRLYLKPKIEYGDMIAFSSQKTREILESENKNPSLGFIKRVIALPGDEIELRDGYVLRNGSLIDEPYIRSPRSTYGGSLLPECKKITVPNNSYFVLGDNRKVSSDSRFSLSFVNDGDIQFYLPFAKQQVYYPLWRDTKKDTELMGKSTLDTTRFYAKVTNLKRHNQLEKSALSRAQAILKDPQTRYDLKSSTKDAGYTNILTAEFVIYGHFSDDELWENLISNHETASQLKSPDYQEIGLATANGTVDGCPTQVIVGHLGGYIPASYDAAMQKNWQDAKLNLQEVIPSWEAAIGLEGINQEKLQELLTLLRAKQALVDEVLSVIANREWMSDSLEAKLKQDAINSQRINSLASELSGE